MPVLMQTFDPTRRNAVAPFQGGGPTRALASAHPDIDGTPSHYHAPRLVFCKRSSIWPEATCPRSVERVMRTCRACKSFFDEWIGAPTNKPPHGPQQATRCASVNRISASNKCRESATRPIATGTVEIGLTAIRVRRIGCGSASTEEGRASRRQG